MTDQPPKATVSGSFRRAMGAVQEAVYRLSDAGAHVLSPADPRVVDQFGDFLFVASDRVRVIKLVQSRHLAAIRASHFVWLVAPDGYIGQSGAMELGFAVSADVPIFCSEVPTDLTLRQYVRVAREPEEALDLIRGENQSIRLDAPTNVLLEPEPVLQRAHDDLERLAAGLTSRRGGDDDLVPAAADRVRRSLALPVGALATTSADSIAACSRRGRLLLAR